MIPSETNSPPAEINLPSDNKCYSLSLLSINLKRDIWIKIKKKKSVNTNKNKCVHNIYIIGVYTFSDWDCFYSFLQQVLLVLFFRLSTCISCFYSFLQLVPLVFIPSFSLYLLFLFRPWTCTSCFLFVCLFVCLLFACFFVFCFFVFQHVYFVFITSFGMYLSAIKFVWSDCLGPETYYFSSNGPNIVLFGGKCYWL